MSKDSGSRKIIAFPGLLPDDKPVAGYSKALVADDIMNRFDKRNSKSPDSLSSIPNKGAVKKLSMAEMIQSEQVIDIPVSLIRPMNGRMFCIAVDPSEKKTKGGVIMATSYNQSRGDDNIKRDFKRYFVIDVAGDMNYKYQPLDINEAPRTIRRGDEIFPFFPEEMTHWNVPVVIDWNNGGMKYCVFHESELAGAGLISLIEEEKEKKEKK